MAETQRLVIGHLGDYGPSTVKATIAAASERTSAANPIVVSYNALLKLIAQESVYIDEDMTVYLADRGDKEYREIARGGL